jgi:PAS domain-containing protein
MNPNNAQIVEGTTAEEGVEGPKTLDNNLRALIESVPLGIVFADEGGRITDLNAEILRMFGYSRHELLGQVIEKLLPEGLRHSHQEHRSAYAHQPHARRMGQGMELVACRKLNEPRIIGRQRDRGYQRAEKDRTATPARAANGGHWTIRRWHCARFQ